jgi:glycosyltransferase involved in cell wall biosynthesis
MINRKDLQKKTIIFFTDSHNWGGAENYLISLASNIDRTIYNPVVVRPEGGDEEKFDQECGKNSIPVHSCTTSNEYPLLSFFRSLFFFFKHKPDLIHFNLSWPPFCRYPLLAAIILRKMIVITEHLVPHNYKVQPYEKFYKKFIYSRIFQSITVCEENRTNLMNVFEIPEDKVRVIHNGIPVEQFQQISPSNGEPDITSFVDGKTVVTTIARLAEHKGHRYLIQAAQVLKHLPQICFLIVGKGPLEASLKQEIREAGMEDRFLLISFRTDISYILSKTSIFVLPSTFEGLPLTILEAMAAAKPVIASDISGIPEEVIDGITGILVPSGDPGSLAHAINDLASNPHKRKHMGEQGKRRVNEHFTLPRMVSETEQLYEEATGTHLSDRGQSY